MRTGFWVSFPTRWSASGGRRESQPRSSAKWSGGVCRPRGAAARRAGNLQLTVEDDGKGFSFSGRRSDAELETSGKGPGVIRERVRLLAAELTIESTPGHGARLEVRIPPARKANHG